MLRKLKELFVNYNNSSKLKTIEETHEQWNWFQESSYSFQHAFLLLENIRKHSLFATYLQRHNSYFSPIIPTKQY